MCGRTHTHTSIYKYIHIYIYIYIYIERERERERRIQAKFDSLQKMKGNYNISAKNKSILKDLKIATRLCLEDNSLLIVVTVSFHYGFKTAPKPFCVPEKIFEHLFDHGYQVDFRLASRTVIVILNRAPPGRIIVGTIRKS